VLKTQPTNPVMRFGAFEIDMRTGELRKHGIRIKLQDQPFRVLQILLEHPGEVVTREELQRQIWPSDTFVDFDRGLNNAVKRLRETLGDSVEAPRYIETLAKRGYRFIGPLERNGQAPTLAAAQPTAVSVQSTEGRSPRTRAWRTSAFVVLGLIMTSAVVFGLDVGKVRSSVLFGFRPPEIHSLAVLPLENLSGDSSQEYFADGMTDALITDVAQIGSLKVISRTSILRYKKTNKPLPEIARELNVDGIVEGTVQRSGDRVRITAQLIHGPTDKHLWANSYERNVADVFGLQREVTEDIAAQIKAHLTPQQNRGRTQPRPVSIQALELYFQGKQHLDRVGQGFGDEENKKAAELFQQAIDADPNFVQAYLGLADSHSGLLLPTREDQAIIARAHRKIEELDPGSAATALLLAQSKAGNWDWTGAEHELRRALALNPNDSAAHHWFALFLDDVGRLDEGWKEEQIAQALNPNPDRLPSATDWPEALFRRGQYDEAIRVYLRILEANPDDGQTHLGLSESYEGKGMYKEAIAELGRVCRAYGHADIETRLNRAYAIAGYRGALRQWAEEIERQQATKQVYMPAYLASVYVRLDDKDRAFYWLEDAYKHHDEPGLGTDLVQWLKGDPFLKPIRNDPRYFDLLRRVGLPP
jgi:TolB-like protein/DNA-binding winged helix-turn-helix (wHTH) protein/tetratricopeptide (TPR) repeat protein